MQTSYALEAEGLSKSYGNTLVFRESKERTVIISLTEVERKFLDEATLMMNTLQLK